MYTIDGTEVFVVKKIEDGYLAKQIYYYNGHEEEDESDIEEMSEQIVFYEKLYEKPFTEKYAKEVNLLTEEKNKLEKAIADLRKLKSEEEYLLNKINKFPVLKKLADYLTGDFKLYMSFSDFEIIPKEKAWFHTNVKVVNFRSTGWCLYRLRNENSDSYDDTPFMIFNTTEEAVEFTRNMLIESIQQFKKHEYWGSDTLKDKYRKISSSNPVKEDSKLLEVYNETLAFVIKREQDREKEKLRKELEDLEAKKKKLESLSK